MTVVAVHAGTGNDRPLLYLTTVYIFLLNNVKKSRACPVVTVGQHEDRKKSNVFKCRGSEAVFYSDPVYGT